VQRFDDLGDLAARFVGCTLPREEWTHAAHLAVGAWHVHRYGADEALTRLRTGIRRLNESHGTPNTATSGYHETVTRAYVRLLAQYMAACSPSLPLAARVDRLLVGPLAARDVLMCFYARDTLMSERARAGWIEPDVAPIELATALREKASA
jgi:hypothetical protein